MVVVVPCRRSRTLPKGKERMTKHRPCLDRALASHSTSSPRSKLTTPRLLFRLNTPVAMAHQTIYTSDSAATLQFSQRAPSILGREVTSKTNIVATPKCQREHPEEHETVEQLLIACLQTGDDKSAQLCLDRLTHYFGTSNEKMMGLQGLYEEATAEGHLDLEKCLQKYDGILSENPVNAVCGNPPKVTIRYH